MNKCREATLSDSLNAWADSFHNVFTNLIEDKYLGWIFVKAPQECNAFRLIYLQLEGKHRFYDIFEFICQMNHTYEVQRIYRSIFGTLLGLNGLFLLILNRRLSRTNNTTVIQDRYSIFFLQKIKRFSSN